MGPAGAVQTSQFAAVKVRHILRRVDLQPWLRVCRQRQIHRPVDHRAGKERPGEKREKNDRENRRNETDGDEAAAHVAAFMRSWSEVFLLHCAHASIQFQILLFPRATSRLVQAMASKAESVSSAIIPELAPAKGATSQN